MYFGVFFFLEEVPGMVDFYHKSLLECTGIFVWASKMQRRGQRERENNQIHGMKSGSTALTGVVWFSVFGLFFL